MEYRPRVLPLHKHRRETCNCLRGTGRKPVIFAVFFFSFETASKHLALPLYYSQYVLIKVSSCKRGRENVNSLVHLPPNSILKDLPCNFFFPRTSSNPPHKDVVEHFFCFEEAGVKFLLAKIERS